MRARAPRCPKPSAARTLHCSLFATELQSSRILWLRAAVPRSGYLIFSFARAGHGSELELGACVCEQRVYACASTENHDLAAYAWAWRGL